MLAGLIAPSSGTATLDGHRIDRHADHIRRRIGFLTEAPGHWERLSVHMNLLVYARLHGLEQPGRVVDAALGRFGLGDRADVLVAELSKGLKQKLAIARALLHNPRVLLLDEPTSGLDPQTARTVREMVVALRDEGRAIVLSSHNLDEVERLADRVAVIERRLIAVDSPTALRHRLFGRRVRIDLVQASRRLRSDCACRGGREPPDARLLAVARRGRRHAHPESRTGTGRCRCRCAGGCPGGRTARRRVPEAHPMNGGRIRAILVKELADLRRNRAALLPVVTTAIACLSLPFFVTLAIPAIAGEPLSSDPSFRASLAERGWMGPSLARLDNEAAAHAFIYQQFFVFFLIVPVTGAMAFAAHSIIGEKQARTLEPLLATPLTTTELLVAKIVAAMIPSLLITQGAAALYLTLIAAVSGPAVLAAILTPRTGALLVVLGPLAALVALELAVIASSRSNDPRTAQQVGVLIILPLTGLMVAQFAGGFWLTGRFIVFLCTGLVIVASVLLAVGVRLFDRETILTRWR